MSAIQLHHSSPEIQATLDELGDDDRGRVADFLRKVQDYRALLQRRDYHAAARYHHSLTIEIEQLRERFSDLKTYAAAGAATGAAAGAWLFGVSAIVTGLAGGAVGYMLAKQRKESMMKLCDTLLMELGPRPGG